MYLNKIITPYHTHEFTNWWCPFYDEGERIDTCCICGKLKGRNIKYVGRRKDGSRIIEKFSMRLKNE